MHLKAVCTNLPEVTELTVQGLLIVLSPDVVA